MFFGIPDFALRAALLSFASPKESSQRKGEQKKGEVWNTGFGLWAELLSFASPKESSQRKGEPKAEPLRGALRYARRPGSGANSLRSDKRLSLIHI